MTQITQAFIFAAGRGERMRPLTNSLPKPLVTVKNKAILDYAIEKLDQISSIKKIIINGFYLADQIFDHIKKLNNSKIIFSHEIEKVETGGGLVFASDLIDFSQPLLTVNGDVLWQENSVSDIEILAENFSKNPCDIMLGLKKKSDYFGYEGKGDFYLENSSGKLSRRDGDEMDFVFIGSQIINPKILKSVSQKCFSMSHFYKSAMLSDGSLKGVKGVELSGKYFHIGTVDALNEVQKLV